MKSLYQALAFASLTTLSLFAGSTPNQTDTLSPILPETNLPFRLQIDLAGFTLPGGIQSYSSANYQGKWLILAGRENGLHGFGSIGNNFPPNEQNTTVYVIDPNTGTSWSRSLFDHSALSQEEIDSLSVTAPQTFQNDEILYIVGGYGINTASGDMETKSTLTAIDIPKMIAWVIEGEPNLKEAIRQVSHPILKVTGGALFQANPHTPMLLIMGQNFEGLYRGGSNGQYTMQVRPFWVIDRKNQELSILAKPNLTTNPDFRRRDTNIVPILQNDREAYVTFSGVFTTQGGAWTVPITTFPNGDSFEQDPNDPNTFKQGMNNYDCPAFGLYSANSKEMFVVFPGGISLEYYSNGSFIIDEELPFINQITTIKITKNNRFTQYLMSAQYPYMVSTGSNPGNQLLFGAEAEFFAKEGIPLFRNGVIQLDALPKTPTVIGYIVGGIMSTLPNTSTRSDSTSSPYVFTVTLIPTK